MNFNSFAHNEDAAYSASQEESATILSKRLEYEMIPPDIHTAYPHIGNATPQELSVKLCSPLFRSMLSVSAFRENILRWRESLGASLSHGDGDGDKVGVERGAA